MSTPLSGGYCGGGPPLPIPNREVKPTCADGTAMQCGRVGSRLFSYQSVHLSNQVNAFLVVHFVQYGKSPQSCCPYTDGTPCQIGQCGRVGSRLFLNQSVHLSNQVNAFLVVYQPTNSRSMFFSFYAVFNSSNLFRRHNNKVCYCSYLRQQTNCKVYQQKRHVWDILLLFVFDENI